MNLPNLYNLAFGDLNLITGQLDDKVIIDNGDSKKVLASVVAAVYAFTGSYPDTWVYATGSTDTRTRLCRPGSNEYFDIVEEKSRYISVTRQYMTFP